MLRASMAAVSAVISTALIAGSGFAQKKESYLFVQGADEGVIKAMPARPEAYQITMTGIGPETIFFTDQPERKAGMIDQQAFMKVFARQAAKNVEPNAALVWNAPGRGALIVKLVKSSYNSQDNTLSYEAVVLPTAEGGLVAFNSRKASGPLPERVGKVTLFIDDFDLGCDPWDPRGC
jgi:hypothetical protein